MEWRLLDEEVLKRYIQRVWLLYGCIAATIIIGLLPTFGAMSKYSSTHSYEYGWAISAAYLSGTSVGVVLIILWTFLLLLVRYIYAYLNQSALFSNVDIELENIENSFDCHKFTSRLATFVLFVLNCLTLLAINVIYVAAILQGSTTGTRVLYQIALGVAKFLWGELMVKQIFRRLRPSGINKTDDIHSTVFILLVLIVNNIVVPFIAEATVDPNCFLNVFIPVPEVHVSYGYKLCIYYEKIVANIIVVNTAIPAPVLGKCLINVNVFSALSYSPPFMYRYQCTSSLLTNYVSVFVYMYVAELLNHLVQDILKFLRDRCDERSHSWKLFNFLSGDLHKNNPQFFPPSFVAGLLANVAILLTFGAAFPPLAAIIVLSSSYSCWCTLLMVKQKLIFTEKLLSPVSPTYMWILIIFSSLFYSLFIFDIVSDSVGAVHGAWAPVLMACLPSFLSVAISQMHRLYNYNRVRNRQISITKSVIVRHSIIT